MAKPDPYIVGIDIGSSKVGVLIAQRSDSGELEVVGKGRAPNRGTRRGKIVNVEATVDALKAACEEAEVMAGVEVSRAYVGLAGADIRSMNSRGMVTVSRRDPGGSTRWNSLPRSLNSTSPSESRLHPSNA